MKKITVLLVIFSVLFSACGRNNLDTNATDKSSQQNLKSEDRILLQGAFWVENAEYMHYLSDALRRNDEEYLEQLIIEKKVFAVDRDTHVKRFGYAADSNNELISFKEGRYTNKAGVTLKKFLCTEDEYQKRIETQKVADRKKIEDKELKAKQFREEAISLITNSLNETANYENVIASSDSNYISQFETMCANKGAILQKQIYNFKHDKDVRNMFEKATEIMNERHSVVYYYSQLLKYVQMASASSTNNHCVKHFQKRYDESIQKEKQLRQEFLNTYGF